MNIKIIALEDRLDKIEELRSSFKKISKFKCVVEFVDSENDLINKVSTNTVLYNMVIIDCLYGSGNDNGLQIIKTLRSSNSEIAIVSISNIGNVELASKSIKAGANDFIVRGEQFHNKVKTLINKIQTIIQLLEKNTQLEEQNRLLIDAEKSRHNIITNSSKMLDIINRIDKICKIPRPVLIRGERGTGKELIAHAIHNAGEYKKPMIVVNCAAFNDNLLESELFGHVKGAFTGADTIKIGKFEQANDSILFLDEIGNMSLAFQQKILRVVEYGTFTPVGGTVDIKTTARVIGATNSDIEDKISKGEFLSDLYDRLTFEEIRIPPLRERKEDINLLALNFLHKFMEEIPSLKGKRLASSAIEALNSYEFSGNIRELKNIIERAAYRDTTNEITPEDIGLLRGNENFDVSGKDFMEKVSNFKKQLIENAMEETGNNQAKAARLLGLGYHQFRHYLKQYS